MKKKINKSSSQLISVFLLLGCFGMLLYIIQSRNGQDESKTIITKERVIEKSVPIPVLPKRRINIHTRGEPPSYKNVGYISHDNQSENEIEVLSLYGRPTYRGSNKWNYYTMHDGVRIPIETCDKSRGCDEKYDGDVVNIEPLGGDYAVKVYDDDAPRYIPY